MARDDVCEAKRERIRELVVGVDVGCVHQARRTSECRARSVPSDCNDGKQTDQHTDASVLDRCGARSVGRVSRRRRRHKHADNRREECDGARVVPDRRTRRRRECASAGRRERGRGNRVDIGDLCTREARKRHDRRRKEQQPAERVCSNRRAVRRGMGHSARVVEQCDDDRPRECVVCRRWKPERSRAGDLAEHRRDASDGARSRRVIRACVAAVIKPSASVWDRGRAERVDVRNECGVQGRERMAA